MQSIFGGFDGDIVRKRGEDLAREDAALKCTHALAASRSARLISKCLYLLGSEL